MRKTVLGLLVIATCFVVSIAQAADQPGRRPGPPAGHPGSPDVMFQRLDANHDGQVTVDEVPDGAPGQLTAMIRGADKNGDKKVSKAELMAAIRRQHGQQGPPAGHPSAGRPPAGHPPVGHPGPRGKPGPPPGHPGVKPAGPAASCPAGAPGQCPAAAMKRPGGPMAGRPSPSFGGGSQRRPDPKQVFALLDTDKNGSLNPAEFFAGMQRLRAAKLSGGRGPGPQAGMRSRGFGRGPMAGRGPGPMMGRGPVAMAGRGPGAMMGRGPGPMAGRGPVDREAIEARIKAFRAQREKAAAQSKAKAAPTRQRVEKAAAQSKAKAAPTRQRVEAVRREQAQQKTDRPVTDRPPVNHVDATPRGQR